MGTSRGRWICQARRAATSNSEIHFQSPHLQKGLRVDGHHAVARADHFAAAERAAVPLRVAPRGALCEPARRAKRMEGVHERNTHTLEQNLLAETNSQEVTVFLKESSVKEERMSGNRQSECQGSSVKERKYMKGTPALWSRTFWQNSGKAL